MAMMGIRRDTKAFAPAGASGNRVTDNQQERSMTNQELNQLGASDLGELANKIADANWVDPQTKNRGVGNDKLDKDAFMKIMLVQMKNQDPTNPLKSHEMAAQLAQFTQLEQLQNINTNLDEMKAQAKPTESFQSLNLLGKVVAGDSSKIYRTKGDREHEVRYQLPANAKSVTIKVSNEMGDVVRSFTQNNVPQGNSSWQWNGKDNAEKVLPAGNYQVTIEALASNDNKITAKTDFEGVISGVNFTPSGTLLMVGNQAIRLQDVRKIVDPGLKNKDQNLSSPKVPDLKSTAAIGSNEEEGAPEAQLPAGSRVLEQAALSREMMEKIAKDLSPAAVKGGERERGN